MATATLTPQQLQQLTAARGVGTAQGQVINQAALNNALRATAGPAGARPQLLAARQPGQTMLRTQVRETKTMHTSQP